MDILRIRLTGFMSHEDTEIEFSDTRPYLFIGENGGGKSSLVKDGPTWVVFGEARALGAGDDLIRNGEKKCRGEVDIRVNNVTYRVARSRERNKKTELSLARFTQDPLSKSPWTDITNVTTTATQQDIIKILGFEYQAFIISACFEQGSKFNFSELTPKQCKDMVLSILNLGRYNDYEKAAREKFTEAEREMFRVQSRLDFSREKLVAYRNVANDLYDLGKSREAVMARIGTLGVDMVASKAVVDGKIASLESEIAAAEKSMDDLRKAYKDKEYAMMGASQELSSAGQELLRLSTRAKKLHDLGHKCPTCESEIGENHVASLMAEIDTEIAAQGKLRDDASDRFKTLQADLSRIEEQGKSFNLLEKRESLKRLAAELVRLSTNSDMEKEKSRLVDIEKSIAVKNSEAAAEEGLRGEIVAFDAELAVLAKHHAKYRLLVEAFGKNGVPALIISNAVIELEMDVNRFLRELTSKSISVKFAMEKSLKSTNEMSDTLEIVIRDGAIERPYALYSGGERFRIDLAIRLGLARILARRNNFKLETLILDEPAFLDKGGLSNLKDILLGLRQSFSKIFVVSHLDELIEDGQNRFNVVEVHNIGGKSVLKKRG